jgi:hypothetical protein
MNLSEIGWVVVDWIYLIHDRDWWWAVVNTNELLGFINDREFLDWLGFSRRTLLRGVGHPGVCNITYE